MLFYPMLPDCRNCCPLFEGSHASPACPSDKNISKINIVRIIVGMVLAEENQSTQRKTCLCADLSNTSVSAVTRRRLSA
jgi:hypothetical protein